MLSPTWTPDALRSELGPWDGEAWRLVEAQHVVSSLKLVDTLEEQDTLEAILEDSKPPMPVACRHLHYLLSTPFRYRPYKHGSRFRRAGLTPGVWYGADRPEISVAEMVFYRYLFYAEAPDVPFPRNAAAYTAFAARVRTPAAIDLTSDALERDAARWEHPTDYAPCQDLEDAARQAECGLIRYRSVRDPGGGMALAILSCDAFEAPEPQAFQTWHVSISRSGAVARREHPREAIQFATDAFDSDPRVSGMVWDRR